MNPKNYAHEIEKRGGKNAVAKILGLSISSLNRRLTGEHAITPEATLALGAIPVRPEWSELSRLVRDREHRNHYKVWTLALPHGQERQRRLALLAEAGTHVTGRKVPLPNGGRSAPRARLAARGRVLMVSR